MADWLALHPRRQTHDRQRLHLLHRAGVDVGHRARRRGADRRVVGDERLSERGARPHAVGARARRNLFADRLDAQLATDGQGSAPEQGSDRRRALCGSAGAAHAPGRGERRGVARRRADARAAGVRHRQGDERRQADRSRAGRLRHRAGRGPRHQSRRDGRTTRSRWSRPKAPSRRPACCRG